MWLATQAEGPEHDEQLVAELAQLDDATLAAHAGRVGWRWATTRLAELDPDEVQIDVGRVVVVELERPRVVFRYAGGGLVGLVADAPVSYLARAQVLATLAVRRAMGGQVPEAPEVVTDPGEVGPLQTKVRLAARALFIDTVALGAAHLSADIAERYESVATSAQGAKYHRLARLLRRMADHVDQIRARDARADAGALLEEAALGLGLVDALGGPEPVPDRLVGSDSAQYDEVRELDLVGLGGRVWASRTGYRGLEVLFWWPAKQRFCTWNEARPDTVRGFDPRRRWSAPGPWSGVRAPYRTAGARVRLRSVQLAGGRLSSRESTQAIVIKLGWRALVDTLAPVDDFATLLDRPPVSLLDPPGSQRDWVVLRPAAFGGSTFDPFTQTLTWVVEDGAGVRLPLCVPWTTATATTVEAVERCAAAALPPGTLLVAQVHTLDGSIVGEPLSLVRPDTPEPVQSFCFATGPSTHPERAPAHDAPSTTVDLPPALLDLQDWLARAGERGTGASAPVPLLAELETLTATLRRLGLHVFVGPVAGVPVAEQVLRTSYLVCQVRLLLGGAEV